MWVLLEASGSAGLQEPWQAGVEVPLRRTSMWMVHVPSNGTNKHLCFVVEKFPNVSKERALANAK